MVFELILSRQHARVLVLSPKSVLHVWQREYEKHLDDGRVLCVLDSGTSRDKAAEARQVLATKRPALVVTNYDAFWRPELFKVLAGSPWDLLVMDEAHRLKSPSGVASRAAARIPAFYRLALTGTPMPHSPLDIYAVYRALDRSVFGTSFTLFRNRYAVMGGFENHQVVRFVNLEELNSKVYSIAFRVGQEVLDLPEEVHTERMFSLCPKARKVYRNLEEEFIDQVDAGVVTASNALVKLLRLQQITSGFVSVCDWEGDECSLEAVDNGKADLLLDVLQDLPESEPVVIFARFRHDLGIIRRVADSLGRGSGEVSGLANNLQAWQRGEFPILAVQIQAGGLGVDLTRAAYSVFFSLGFSLGEYEQALARTHRPGQTRSVNHIHLIASGTVDEKVYRALREKKAVIEEVLRDYHERKDHGRREAPAILRA